MEEDEILAAMMADSCAEEATGSERERIASLFFRKLLDIGEKSLLRWESERDVCGDAYPKYYFGTCFGGN